MSARRVFSVEVKDMEPMAQDDRTDVMVAYKVPASLVEQIDELAHRELMSRSAWLRRAALLEVRASRRDVAMA
jgi:hypothetical protein